MDRRRLQLLSELYNPPDSRIPSYSVIIKKEKRSPNFINTGRTASSVSAMRSYALAICIFTVFFTDSQNISDFPVLQFIGENKTKNLSLHFGGKESIACWTSTWYSSSIKLFSGVSESGINSISYKEKGILFLYTPSQIMQSLVFTARFAK